ncbi:MAG: hypothetical protein F4120_11150 [Rhodothermaceae bacterium]|nr:hypothetical protein [Rhodothermaceae bacterium]MXW33861.1 hypothetical protein [Rhodothermaceae bacterium]MYC04791.1 hypothetical protein [Rhodothermaceae bacterium]MYE62700.1 hypothetical protein [Rhodothermaceae bacterium]MYI18157.1 hypothetical protein [Rhodothermaceae bacterium]
MQRLHYRQRPPAKPTVNRCLGDRAAFVGIDKAGMVVDDANRYILETMHDLFYSFKLLAKAICVGKDIRRIVGDGPTRSGSKAHILTTLLRGAVPRQEKMKSAMLYQRLP